MNREPREPREKKHSRDGAHGVTRPTGPKVAKNCSTLMLLWFRGRGGQKSFPAIQCPRFRTAL